MKFRLVALLLVGLVAAAGLGASLAAVEGSTGGVEAASLCQSAFGNRVVRAVPTTVGGVRRREVHSTGPRIPLWFARVPASLGATFAGLCWVKAGAHHYALEGVRKGAKHPAGILGVPSHWSPRPTVTPGRATFP